MRLIDPSEWNPEGRVTVWDPTREMLDTLRAKEPVEQPLSFLQADHVRAVLANRAAGVKHQAYTAAAIRLPYPVDIDRLTQSLNEYLGAHQGLRCSIEAGEVGENGAPTIVRRLLSAGEVSLEPRSVDDADISGNAAEWMRNFFSATAVSDHFPALAAGLIQDPEHQTADFVLALDHAVADGLSQAIAVLEIASRYLGQQSPLTQPEQPSFLDYVNREYQVAAQVPADSAGTKLWQECIEFAGGVPRLGFPIGVENNEPQEVAVVPNEGPIADAEQLQALRALAKSRGYSFSTVMYAILALAHKRMSGSDKYATVTVSSTRGKEFALSQGWFCNFNPLFFTVEKDSVEELLDTVAEAQQRMKNTLAEPVHASLNNLITQGVVGPEVFQSPQMVTYMDLSWFSEPEGADLRVFGGVGKTKNANFWVARNPEGLVIGSQSPNNDTARNNVAQYFAEAHKIVQETVLARTNR